MVALVMPVHRMQKVNNLYGISTAVFSNFCVRVNKVHIFVRDEAKQT